MTIRERFPKGQHLGDPQGITGWTIRERIEYDRCYIDNWSLLLALNILLPHRAGWIPLAHAY